MMGTVAMEPAPASYPPAARRRLENRLHAAALLAGMVALLGVLGWFLAGRWGVAVAAGMGLGLGLAARRVPPWMVLRLYRGRPVLPEGAPELYRVLEALAARAGLPAVPVLYWVPSPVLNAFAAGTPADAAIGVTDGLLRGLSFRELAAVLAHEVSHLKSGDLAVMGLADLISRLTALFALVGQLLLVAGLPLVLMGKLALPLLPVLLLILAPSLAALLQMGLSRLREYDADLEAARMTGDPEALALALARMDLYPGGWLERLALPGRRVPHPSLLRSHPPTEERVRRLMALVSGLTPAHGPLWLPAGEGPWIDATGRVRRRPRWRLTGLWY